MVEAVRRPVPQRGLDGELHLLPVLGVHSVQERFVIRTVLAGLVAEEPIHLVGPPLLVANDVPLPATKVSDTLGGGEDSLAPAQLLLRLLALCDVCAGADPLPDVPVFLQHGNAARREVPVVPVLATETILDVVNAPRSDHVLPHRRGALAVVGVQRIEPARALDLILSLPRVGSPRRQVGLHEPFRGRRPHYLGGGLHQRAVPLLAPPQILLCPSVLAPVISNQGYPHNHQAKVAAPASFLRICAGCVVVSVRSILPCSLDENACSHLRLQAGCARLRFQCQ